MLNQTQLEQEFSKLVELLYDKVKANLTEDKLSEEDAQQLANYIKDRIGSSISDVNKLNAINAYARQPVVSEYDDYDDQYWSNSGCVY